MAVKEILRLGNPGLWKVCATVKNYDSQETKKIIRDLKDTLEDFRKKNGFGRAIAAPQIGVLKRIIYVDFPKEKISGALLNPKIIKKSKEKTGFVTTVSAFPNCWSR